MDKKAKSDFIAKDPPGARLAAAFFSFAAATSVFSRRSSMDDGHG
jgi:hypothetical protein